MKPRKGKNDYSALEYHCLVRATDGDRKLTTEVRGSDLAKFQDSYTTIMRVSTASMFVCVCVSGGRVVRAWQLQRQACRRWQRSSGGLLCR